MGLTVHYNIRSSSRSTNKVLAYVEQMRQLALDLPFEEVGDLVVKNNPDHKNETDDSLRWLYIQSGQYVDDPLDKHCSWGVEPIKLIAFNIYVGPGSEPANIGLCLFPKEIVKEGRTIKTKLGGWRWGSFCKTQYASNPSCGGIPNFLRCHISLITLLDRIAELPTISVKVADEGKYGPSNYTDDYTVPDPHYYVHEGKYNPKALVEEIIQWNETPAGFAGMLKDALGNNIVLESPITSFQDFEALEFKGSRNVGLQPFLESMKTLANKMATPDS